MRGVIERVPTEVNIGDLPRREGHDLLAQLGARRAQAGLAQVFASPACKHGSCSARATRRPPASAQSRAAKKI
eukprot:9463853-Pyramimonas_sp.AAC.1